MPTIRNIARRIPERAGRFALLSLALSALLLPACGGDDPDGPDGPGKTAPATVKVASNTTRMPSGGVLSSQYEDSPEGCGIAQIVDNNNYSVFETGHAVFAIHWAGYEGSAVNSYSLTSGPDAPEADPRSWALFGSNDDANWTLLDRRTDRAFAERKQKLEFEFDNRTSYRYLKLEIEANNGGSTTRIAELTIRKVSFDIDDLMEKASGYTASTVTPMGSMYANAARRHTTTDEDRAWLADPANEPDVPATNRNSLEWTRLGVHLYPTAGAPSPADVNQHAIGDCCMLAVFASFAYIYPDFIRSIIADNGDQTYTVAMFDPQAKPVKVTVGTKFLTDRNGTIQAASGKNNVACWSTVLEKAVMKWNMIYKVNTDVNGIGTESIPPLFTGNGSSFAFERGVLDGPELARAVKNSLLSGKFVVGGFWPGDIPFDDTKTVTAHAYTFMHSSDHSALCAVRNPWGGNPDQDGSRDGVANVPDNLDIPPLVDLRIVEPGLAGESGSGVSVPYTPPVFASGAVLFRVSPELMRSGM